MFGLFSANLSGKKNRVITKNVHYAPDQDTFYEFFLIMETLIFRRDIFYIANKNSPYLYVTGPRSVGKTTIAQYISKQLEIDFFDMDVILDEYLKYKGGICTAIDSQNWDAIENAIQQALEMLLNLPHPYVISVGAGIFKYSISNLALERAIFLGLLPDKNKQSSIQKLFEREKKRDHFINLQKMGDDAYQKVIKKTQDDLEYGINITESIVDILCFTGEKTSSQIFEDCILDKRKDKIP